VFRAYDPSQDRLVAVKWLRLGLAPEQAHRLVADLERLIAADLTHPALATPLATGIVDASPFLAQDFVAADSLDTVLREHGRMSPSDAVRVAEQLAGALDCAAAAGFVHGALHPRDVLVSPDDARLTGVGVLAAVERAGGSGPVRRPYAAPERAAGAAWDRRADVFGLAALLHELLWGRRIAGTGPEAAATLTALPGTNLDVLRDVFSRALAESPDARFSTALELAEALTAAVPPTPLRQARARRLPLDETDDLPLLASRAGEPELTRAPDLVVPPSIEFQDEGEPGALYERRTEPGRGDEHEVADGRTDDFFSEDEVSPLDLDRMAVASPLDLDRMAVASQPDEDEPPANQTALTAPWPDPALPATPPDRLLERASTALWPLVLALVVGLAVGFAGGYIVGNGGARPAADAAAESPAATTGTVRRDLPEKPAVTPAVPVEPAPQPPADAPAPPRPAAPPPATSNRLTIRSTPPGARVWLDGRALGVTPIAADDVPAGEHTVRLTREGYTTQQRRVVVSGSGPSQPVTFELRRVPEETAPPVPGRPGGPLRVESRPSGARVFLDGKPIGTTPLELPEIEVGEHVVRLELEGYRQWASSVNIASGERNRVAASLERD
jgi:hypothetical protein